MNDIVRYSKKTGAFLQRMFLAGLLSLIISGLIQTQWVVAEGLSGRKSDSPFAIPQPAGTPTNDDFPGTEISSLPYGDLNVDISGATTAVDDPDSIVLGDCDSNHGEFSVWYNFDPGNQNEYVTFDTIGSDYDTIIAIWTGVQGSLNLVACNDDISLYNIQSEVSIFAQANVTYYIEIINWYQSAPTTTTAQGTNLNFHASEKFIDVSPANLDFGDKLYRNWTNPKTVTVTNLGSNPVQLGTLSISDSETVGQTMYLMNNACDNVSLNTNESCTFNVAFRPIVEATVVGQVTIPSDAPGQPDYASLTGNGIRGTAFVTNFSFETDTNNDKLPDSWNFTNITSGLDRLDSLFSRHLIYSMRFVGQDPRQLKTATQTINLSGSAGHDFTFLLWSKAVNAPDKGIRCIVYWYNGTTVIGEKRIVWNPGTYDFKQYLKVFTTPTAYTHIVIEISYTQLSGAAWVDLTSFRWAPSPDY